MTDLDRALTAAVEAARAAGQVALRYYRTGFEVALKADDTPVTQADRGAEQAIRDVLGAAFPDHGFLGEELGAVGDQQRRWIIDPIDGTRNFIRRLPVWATLIGLEEQGEIVQFEVLPAGADRPIAVEGAVRSVRPGRLGVQFIRVHADDEGRLREYLYEVFVSRLRS